MQNSNFIGASRATISVLEEWGWKLRSEHLGKKDGQSPLARMDAIPPAPCRENMAKGWLEKEEFSS